MVDVITAYVTGATAEGYSEDWDLEKLWEALKTLYPVGIDHHDLIDSDAVGEAGELTRDELLDALVKDAERAYAAREEQIDAIGGEGAMRQLERNVLLNVIDRKWREHLYEMDYLKEGIGLRAMAQRDPLVEYQREGYDMFVAMLDGLKEESVGFLFNVAVEAAPQTAPVVTPMSQGLAEFAAAAAEKASATAADQAQSQVATKERPAGVQAKGIGAGGKPALTYSGPAEDGSAEVKRSGGAANTTGGTRRERREAARKGSRKR
jgi:preprotein translocase subunit SecA